MSKRFYLVVFSIFLHKLIDIIIQKVLVMYPISFHFCDFFSNSPNFFLFSALYNREAIFLKSFASFH